MPGSREEDFERNNAFSLHDIWPLRKNPSLGVMKVTILVDHYYILILYDLSLGVEMTIFKEIMHFHYMTCMDTP